ncbi:hypothetical protein Pfo_013307 [Paulownia fortunei]|nr:hypothetical protein Pfo_013307 [Paulownia fortunei]
MAAPEVSVSLTIAEEAPFRPPAPQKPNVRMPFLFVKDDSSESKVPVRQEKILPNHIINALSQNPLPHNPTILKQKIDVSARGHSPNHRRLLVLIHKSSPRGQLSLDKEVKKASGYCRGVTRRAVVVEVNF